MKMIYFMALIGLLSTSVPVLADEPVRITPATKPAYGFIGVSMPSLSAMGSNAAVVHLRKAP